MKIVRVRIIPFAIPFRQPLYAGGAALRERRGCLVELWDAAGRVGIGEAAPLPGASAFDLGALERDLRTTSNAVLNVDADLQFLLRRSMVARYGPTRAAIEMALYDLEATRLGARVADLLGSTPRNEVRVNALLGGEPRHSAMAAKLAGFTCVKLKIDGRDIAGSCDALRSVRDALGEELGIRVDLNRSWTVPEAIRGIPMLAAYGVELIEQPVASIAELAAVRSAVEVPIAADECVIDEESIRLVAAAGAADVVVLKPALVGLSEAMLMARTAAECGLDVVVTSALDTSVGIAAALHLVATLPDSQRHHGLATASLLAGDLVEKRLVAQQGTLRFPDRLGLGVRIDEDAIARWRLDAAGTAAVL